MNDAGRVQRETVWRAAVLSGDANAWRAWHSETFAALYAYALWRCGGRNELADEVVQEAWLIAVRRIAEFQPARASFLTWLRAIVGNVIRNQLRQKRRRTPTVSLNGTHAISASSADRGERITETLASLPEHYETVLRAKYVDGCTVEEIARERSESPKAIESLLTRARQAFREAFERDESKRCPR